MKTINYILNGFGFTDFTDFKISSFGFMGSMKVINFAAFFALFMTLIEDLFGLPILFVVAYCVLIIFEWVTGVAASLNRGEEHKSRKLGRMLLKITAYTIPIYILNTFQDQVDFPMIAGFEFDPFTWLYWTVLFVIVWQLLVSLLENLDSLGVPFAKILLKVINKKFYDKYNLGDVDSTK